MGAPCLKNQYAMFKKLVCQWVKENEFKTEYYVSKCTFESTCPLVHVCLYCAKQCCMLHQDRVVVGIEGVCSLCACVLGMAQAKANKGYILQKFCLSKFLEADKTV